MRCHRFLGLAALSFGAAIALNLSACRLSSTGAAPGIPETFVMAWTDPSNAVNTAESRDGGTFINLTTHVTAGGPPASSNFAPAIANDGRLTWMLLWAHRGGRHLSYELGLGGIPSSGNGGVLWDGAPRTIDLPLETSSAGLPVLVASKPTLAFGNGRWVIVYRTNNGNKLKLVRSKHNSTTDWEAPVDLAFGSNSIRDVGIAFGANRFVLLFFDGGPAGPIVRVRVSSDGQAWTTPTGTGVVGSNAGITDGSIGLTFGEGGFYAAIPVGIGGGQRLGVFRAPSGEDWTADSLGNTASLIAATQAAPGIAYGKCTVVVAQRDIEPHSEIQLHHGSPNNCAQPTAVTFATAVDLTLTNLSGQGTALSFASTAP